MIEWPQRDEAEAAGCLCEWIGRSAIGRFDPACPILGRHRGGDEFARARAAITGAVVDQNPTEWGFRQTAGTPTVVEPESRDTYLREAIAAAREAFDAERARLDELARAVFRGELEAAVVIPPSVRHATCPRCGANSANYPSGRTLGFLTVWSCVADDCPMGRPAPGVTLADLLAPTSTEGDSK